MLKSFISFVLLANLFFFASAKIIVTLPKNNKTAQAVHKTLLNEAEKNFNGATKCGLKFLEDSEKVEDYSNCIKALKVPKIYEENFLKLSANDFDELKGQMISSTLSYVIHLVCKGIEQKCVDTDPTKVNAKLYNQLIRENMQTNDYKLMDETEAEATINKESEGPQVNIKSEKSSGIFAYLFFGLLSLNIIAILSYFLFRKSSDKKDEESNV